MHINGTTIFFEKLSTPFSKRMFSLPSLLALTGDVSIVIASSVYLRCNNRKWIALRTTSTCNEIETGTTWRVLVDVVIMKIVN